MRLIGIGLLALCLAGCTGLQSTDPASPSTLGDWIRLIPLKGSL